MAEDSAGAEFELTILMPCLDEAATLAVCIGKARGYLARSGVAGEVVIADNGSTDGSQAIAEAAGARVIAVAARGYGAALQGGIRAARGRYVIMGDADDSYDFSALDGFVAKLREGYALVVGNRFRGGIRPGAMPVAEPLSRQSRAELHRRAAVQDSGRRFPLRAARLRPARHPRSGSA